MIILTIVSLAAWIALSFAYYAGYSRCEKDQRTAAKRRQSLLPRVPKTWVTNVPVKAKDFETISN